MIKSQPHIKSGQFGYMRYKHAELVAAILPVVGNNPFTLAEANAIWGDRIPGGYINGMVRINILEIIRRPDRSRFRIYIPALYRFTRSFIDHAESGKCRYLEAAKCQQS